MTRPLLKADSTSPFHEGRRPAWCEAIPHRKGLTRSCFTDSGWDRRSSSIISASRALSLCFSRGLLARVLYARLAAWSQALLLKMNQMQGNIFCFLRSRSIDLKSGAGSLSCDRDFMNSDAITPLPASSILYTGCSSALSDSRSRRVQNSVRGTGRLSALTSFTGCLRVCLIHAEISSALARVADKLMSCM